ncbi:9458_t:CDS:2, partial [Funneliformis caledonium]
TVTFEVSQLLLDESDDESNTENEFANENETTNISLLTFPDLHYILRFLHFEALVDTRKNHYAFT